MLSRTLLVIFFAVLSSTHVDAGAILLLEYQGVTGTNSSIAGVSIAEGTSFDLQFLFPDTYIESPGPGNGNYLPISITANVAGTSYTVDSQVEIILIDPEGSLFGYYGPYLQAGSPGGGGFAPYYSGTTTPGWSATAPTPTEFSGYLHSLNNSISLSTNDGLLVLDYDRFDGVTTRISEVVPVPEPSSVLLYVLGLFCTVRSRYRFSSNEV
jgi:hypothetical protein